MKRHFCLARPQFSTQNWVREDIETVNWEQDHLSTPRECGNEESSPGLHG